MEVTRSTDGDRADFPRLLNRYIIRGDATWGRFALVEHSGAGRSWPSATGSRLSALATRSASDRARWASPRPT